MGEDFSVAHIDETLYSLGVLVIMQAFNCEGHNFACQGLRFLLITAFNPMSGTDSVYRTAYSYWHSY